MSTLLEKRTASLELALEQTASFGEAILSALTGMTARLYSLEQALEQNADFAESVPKLLQEISDRVGALEQTLKEDALSGQFSEVVLKDFSERMNALKKSIPAILEENTPKPFTPGTAKSTEQVAIDPAIPLKLKEIMERVGVLETRMANIATQQNRDTILTPAVFDALRDTLKSVVERMSIIETSALRLSMAQQKAPFDPTVLEPLQHEVEKVSDRVGVLEHQPRLSPASLDLIRHEVENVSGRVRILEPLRQDVENITDRLGALEHQPRLNPTSLDPLRSEVEGTASRIRALEPLRHEIETIIGRVGALENAPRLDPFLLATTRREIETISDRIKGLEVSAHPHPPALEPVQQDIHKLAGRLDVLETKTDGLSAAKQEAGFGSAFLETIHKISERIERLETKPAVMVDALHDSGPSLGRIQLLTQASHLYPKDRAVVFIGTNNFEDNIKYAFLAFCGFAEGKDMKAIFLCASDRQYDQLRGAGLSCISPNPNTWSPEDAKTLIGAKVAVIGDYFHSRSQQGPIAHALLQGARFVQLWHGLPFTEVGLQNLFTTRSGNRFLAEDLAACGPFDVLTASTVTMRREWERWFSFREFAPVGLPRMDVAFRDLSPQDCINVDERALKKVQVSRSENRRVILYAPTYRDHNPDWIDQAGLDSLAALCRERGWLFYIRLHPHEQDIENIHKRYPSLDFIEPHTDVFPIAKYADCLVTDYSSLTFDFIHAEKPVVFYRPDHADFVLRAQALVQNHEALTAGPITSEVRALAAAIADVFDGPDRDKFRNLRTQLRRKLFDYHDGRSAARLCVVIQRHLDPGIHFVPVVS